MGLFRKTISIKPNQAGYLYINNQLQTTLAPGVYRYFNWWQKIDAVIFPTISKLITITNQEVLTKDNISLRLSYILEYQIVDSDRLINRFNLLDDGRQTNYTKAISEIESTIHNFSQVYLRAEISNLESQELNEHRDDIFAQIPSPLQSELNSYGITVHKLIVRDIYFPKIIQQLFAKQLEAKIRAKLDLENARTTVATARALRNAAELMENNENIKFIQYLETVAKIASQGKHTFVIGEIPNHQLSKSNRL